MAGFTVEGAEAGSCCPCARWCINVAVDRRKVTAPPWGCFPRRTASAIWPTSSRSACVSRVQEASARPGGRWKWEAAWRSMAGSRRHGRVSIRRPLGGRAYPAPPGHLRPCGSGAELLAAEDAEVVIRHRRRLTDLLFDHVPSRSVGPEAERHLGDLRRASPSRLDMAEVCRDRGG